MGELNKYFEKLFNAIDKSHLIPLERKSILYELRELEEAQNALMVPTKNTPQLTEEEIGKEVEKCLDALSQEDAFKNRNRPLPFGVELGLKWALAKSIPQPLSEEKAEEFENAKFRFIKFIADNYKTDLNKGLIVEISELLLCYDQLRAKTIPLSTQPEADKDGWVSVSDRLPELQELEVEGYSEEWINLDFNPRGIRSCSYFESIDGFMWSSAKWNSCHDGYCNDEETIPTHWRKKPQPPVK